MSLNFTLPSSKYRPLGQMLKSIKLNPLSEIAQISFVFELIDATQSVDQFEELFESLRKH